MTVESEPVAAWPVRKHKYNFSSSTGVNESREWPTMYGRPGSSKPAHQMRPVASVASASMCLDRTLRVSTVPPPFLRTVPKSRNLTFKDRYARKQRLMRDNPP